MIRWVALAIVLACALLACTLIVDNQFKDFGSSCKLPGANDNACGTCVTKNCQAQVDTNCSNPQESIIGSLATCIEDPSPGSSPGESRCSSFLDDASVTANGQAPSQFQLRLCVASLCGDDCRKCIDVDAGTSACGQCIMANCGKRLDGVEGCCNNGTVLGWIQQCTDVNPELAVCGDIDDLADAGTQEDGGFVERDSGFAECNTHNFAVCVYDHCIQQGPCK